MLRPAAITALLYQLVHPEPSSSSEGHLAASAGRPHTACLSLLDTSELYAFASRLGEPGPSQPSSVSAAPGRHHSRSRSIPLSLDERAICLSAIAVAAWRNATAAQTAAVASSDGDGDSTSSVAGTFVVGPGMRVNVSKHSLDALGGGSSKGQAADLVPLLLECELGRILVMPIVPALPLPAKSDGSSTERDDDATAHSTHVHGQEAPRPFMLLSLNACSAGRSNLLLGPRNDGTRLSSTGSEATPSATPNRSPAGGSVSSAFDAAELLPNGSAAAAGLTLEVESARDGDNDDEIVWGVLYAQAKALARHLAPSLALCGIGAGGTLHDDDHGDGRKSSQAMSEDEHDE
ncbi:uncharacterized protein PFL1_00847 [Pseudozyma flocculosa PF-1]|uniref:Uncharacterized protein n=1 Tax=Pseudozyma flocculosa TaxID=84751 RepID=A0A5C3F2N7_9BASI|nr:uncharacterized protein PFL1_00847 [Pseudozyma flocculosa PF-1]EPQ31514.1 hypothetical protein PFL1_00847 [Pseudozyma flocculosa PF-1]SPO38698.1 uncharacterized protein PSFLO_04177 [Pseudozyma flocculosa]